MPITVNGYELPPYVSYSAMSTFLDCGHKYFLTRMVKVDEHPGWWLVGGNTVHKITELIDLGDTRPVAEIWPEVWEQETRAIMEKTSVPIEQWKAGGRQSKEWPNKEDAAWWQAKGPDMVRAWIAWRVNAWQLWEPAEGQPAIELALNTSVNDTPIQMIIDRVFITQDGEMVVIDIKTGSRTPSSDLQLGFYAAGIEKTFGVRPRYGAYWMARTGTTSPLIDLDNMPTGNVEKMVGMFDTSRKQGLFLPNFSNCNYCSVIEHCEWRSK